MASKEQKYYGLHACEELFRVRPESIVRAYVTKSTLGTFAALLKWCSGQRKAYHVVTVEELEKVTGSVHHEGICLLAKNRPHVAVEALWNALQQTKGPQRVMVLDGVSNPHNLGALLRLAAHFGVRFVVGEQGVLPQASPSAVRIAAGGAEHVELVAVAHLPQFLAQLKKRGFQVVTTSSHQQQPYRSQSYTDKTALVLGGEVEGVRKEVMAIADVAVKIPGSNQVESLNVATAAAILLAELQREAF